MQYIFILIKQIELNMILDLIQVDYKLYSI